MLFVIIIINIIIIIIHVYVLGGPTKTFADKPVERRDIISMADWLLVIGDQKVQTVYLPLSSGGSTLPSADAAVVPPVAMASLLLPQEPEVKPEPEVTYPVGTKLSWKHAEGADKWYSPNSRTAIVLKDGILQVKEVLNSVTVTTTLIIVSAIFAFCFD